MFELISKCLTDAGNFSNNRNFAFLILIKLPMSKTLPDCAGKPLIAGLEFLTIKSFGKFKFNLTPEKSNSEIFEYLITVSNSHYLNFLRSDKVKLNGRFANGNFHSLFFKSGSQAERHNLPKY